MDEKSLKTSAWQRIVIIAVAIILVGSMIVAYMLVVLGGQNAKNASNAELEAKIAEVTDNYEQKTKELDEAIKPLGERYFDSFKGYLSSAKAYNSANANAAGLKVNDLKTGTGKTLNEGDEKYLAYYLGWCPDGSVFSSSFDSTDKPTALTAPIDPSQGMIEGWDKGIVGMKLGGVREITMSGAMAYGETQEICGAKNSPLKFIVMPIEYDQKVADLSTEISKLRMELLSLYYGNSNN